ncbi:hypothetical protein EDB86DRAFT_3082856 [Lactarius hatsudake]|nr:hypothetical protein EDB86DRAFT_3082856 [Lactarius hatsudake]
MSSLKSSHQNDPGRTVLKILLGLQVFSCLISVFAKRGDIIVADRGVNFAIQKDLQISRSTIELKDKCKYRLVLDECISFGALAVGRTGRGLMELYHVPVCLFLSCVGSTQTQIDMIIESVANGLNSLGGFCAGSLSASEGINILRNTPSILSTLQENVRAIRAVLDLVEAITFPSHAVSPIVHICLRSAATLSASTSVSAKPPNPATPAPRDAPSSRVRSAYCRISWMRRSRKACGPLGRGKERSRRAQAFVTAALSRKECERAAGVIKAAVVKVLTRRK